MDGIWMVSSSFFHNWIWISSLNSYCISIDYYNTTEGYMIRIFSILSKYREFRKLVLIVFIMKIYIFSIREWLFFTKINPRFQGRDFKVFSNVLRFGVLSPFSKDLDDDLVSGYWQQLNEAEFFRCWHKVTMNNCFFRIVTPILLKSTFSFNMG